MKIKVALIQQKYHKTKAKTIKQTLKMIKQASKNKATLVVLQELHQHEYFCQSQNIKYFKYASTWENDKIFWGKIAKQYNIVLVVSLFEKRVNGIYHNTACVFDTNGILAGKYRKMHIPDDNGFYEKFYFTVGDNNFKPIKTSIGNLGVMICWDQWYPESARIMALNGADILIYPTAIGWFDSDSKKEKQRQLNAWVTIQKSHAIANALPLISVNRVGFEKDSSKVLEGIRFWGNSFVCDGQGDIIVQGDDKQEQILYANIKTKKTKKLREIWPFFRDRRIEYYQDINKRFID